MEGKDWLFIGLGVGALYLIYKSSNKVTDDIGKVTGGIGDTIQSASSALNPWLDQIKVIGEIPKGFADWFNSEFRQKEIVLTGEAKQKLVNQVTRSQTDYFNSLPKDQLVASPLISKQMANKFFESGASFQANPIIDKAKLTPFPVQNTQKAISSTPKRQNYSSSISTPINTIQKTNEAIKQNIVSVPRVQMSYDTNKYTQQLSFITGKPIIVKKA